MQSLSAGHAAAAPKHQSRCNVWMGRALNSNVAPRGRFALAQICAVMRLDDRQIDSPSPKPPGFVV